MAPEIKVQQTESFVILGHYLSSDSINNPKKQNFEKLEKIDEDIILHLCTASDNHMMYGSWDMAADLAVTLLNTGTTNENFKQFGKQDSFRHLIEEFS